MAATPNRNCRRKHWRSWRLKVLDDQRTQIVSCPICGSETTTKTAEAAAEDEALATNTRRRGVKLDAADLLPDRAQDEAERRCWYGDAYSDDDDALGLRRSGEAPMICAQCDQPIAAGELYTTAHKRTELPEDMTVMDPIVTVHTGQCPTTELPPGAKPVDTSALACCAGGPQWGHDWHCPTLP